MIALDLNVLLYGMRSDLPQHRLVYDWLESVRADRQPVALFPPVLVGLIRIATNPRVFVNPSLLGTVIHFARALQASPGFEVRPTTERVLARTLALCEQTDAKGNLVKDAFLAAHAIEHGCTWITTDRDFSRFPGLTWRLTPTPTPIETPTPTPTPQPALAPTATSTPAASATPLPASPSAPAMTTMPDEADMSKSDRLRVQDELQSLGYYKGHVDGVFGPLTRAAIRRFQGDIGAEMTGRLTSGRPVDWLTHTDRHRREWRISRGSLAR